MTDKTTIHEQLCNDIHELYVKKNNDYGDSFAKLRQDYPESICIRLQDKMNRLKSLMVDKNQQKVDEESIDDTLMDIANYAIMELTERKYEEDTEFDTTDYKGIRNKYVEAAEKMIDRLSPDLEAGYFRTVKFEVREVDDGEEADPE